MIDQTTLGHRFLVDEFGVTPKTTWQIDVRCGAGAATLAHPSHLSDEHLLTAWL